MISLPPSLLAAALAATAILPTAQPLQLKPTPPPPPKWFPSSSNRPGAASPRSAAWNRSGVSGSGRRHHSFGELGVQFGAEDSLFSFEGGGLADVPKRLSMPNLEVETATIDKDELFAELNALTESFEDLQSSVEYKSQLHGYSETIKNHDDKVETLEEKNALLKRSLKTLTVNLEKQEQELKDLQQQKEDITAQEGIRANEYIGFRLEMQNKANLLEEENNTLRQRLRILEVELSDIAFESRKLMPAPRITTAPSTIAQTDAKCSDVKVVASVSDTKFTPKAPSAPVPPHIIHQQHQLEQLQLQVEEYRRERSSVRKLFGLGIRRGMSKVGKALNLWNPAYNLLLWGELRG